MARKGGLGRGLGALIPQDQSDKKEAETIAKLNSGLRKAKSKKRDIENSEKQISKPMEKTLEATEKWIDREKQADIMRIPPLSNRNAQDGQEENTKHKISAVEMPSYPDNAKNRSNSIQEKETEDTNSTQETQTQESQSVKQNNYEKARRHFSKRTEERKKTVAKEIDKETADQAESQEPKSQASSIKIEDSASPLTTNVLRAMQKLAIDKIEPNPDQPRKNFDAQALSDLAESIRSYGILQPIVVQKHSAPGHAPYQIIAGERRYRAAKMAGLTEVPVVLRTDHLEETALLSVVENVQRQDLTPVEEAVAYREIMNDRRMTQQELADALGKSRPYIANTVRLLQLDNDTLQALEKGQLTSSQGRILLAEKDLKKRATYRKLLLEGKSSVQGLEKKQKTTAQKNMYVVDLEQKLSESLGTPVSIAPRRKGWRVQINCYNEEDMNRLMERLLPSELE